MQALHNYSRGDEQLPRELSVSRSLDDTLDLLRHHLRDVQIEKTIEPDLHVMGFPGQIDQVFMNLITNAAQALNDGASGKARHHPGRRRRRRDEQVEITVSDDGPGIPPEVIPRIFDPFFTTKDVGQGSGLGLSIVHGIVDRHGGRIQVESRSARGRRSASACRPAPRPGRPGRIRAVTKWQPAAAPAAAGCQIDRQVARLANLTYASI